jgi:ParB-like chromosome segregation protein Spo0J
VDTRRIDYLPLDDVKPAARNPRKHNLEGVRASISRFGYATPALRDERTGRLVAGHGRTLALAAMRDAGEDPPAGVRVDDTGAWLVPVVCGWESRSDAEADAYLVADNRWTEVASWDDEGLAALLASIGEVDPELVAAAGFDDEAVSKLLGTGGDADFPPDPDLEEPRLDQRAPLMCPKCAFEWRVGPGGEIEPV